MSTDPSFRHRPSSARFHSHSHSHPRSHTHTHTHSSVSSSDPAALITLLGLSSNLVLTALKVLFSLWLASPALLADAAHGLSDLVADGVVMLTLRWSRERTESDRREYPWGRGKWEAVGSAVVGMFLAVGGVGIGKLAYCVLSVCFVLSIDHSIVFNYESSEDVSPESGMR